ncbi:RNA 2'-phosphotransferase [Natronoglomus mannanivorans]|uniref:Probable RNA 2'-phosphotransferase n=1 Tax=Natronoglomus mannanivorans TaxID=2979990 RepID=A0AAP3E0W0_9EURY|nr:RNA 2'-phosphotransferase [Halobacteria archaeon AArc-xg1-1]
MATETIRTCDEHELFSGDRCPACETRGTQLLSGERRRQLSKYMSGALRHFPEDAGLDLDERGWTDYDALVAAVDEKYGWADESHVEGVIATDPKGRFERTDADDDGKNGRVRAAYGHSVGVTLEPSEAPVPDELFHGTAPKDVGSIRNEGLRPMSRQQVHLSADRKTAVSVGRRHADDPIVFAVDAAAMLADGHRIAKRGSQTYTTDRVPPDYLERVSDDPNS